MNESPSGILVKISNSGQEYFFEKYINSQIELRRKLRKRFDNIINIDIKKIGIKEDKEEKQKIQEEKWEKKVKKYQQTIKVIDVGENERMEKEKEI